MMTPESLSLAMIMIFEKSGSNFPRRIVPDYQGTAGEYEEAQLCDSGCPEIQ
jgi:hypothetical protein